MLLMKSKIIITLSIAEEQAGKWQYGKVFGVAAGSDVGSVGKEDAPSRDVSAPPKFGLLPRQTSCPSFSPTVTESVACQ